MAGSTGRTTGIQTTWFYKAGHSTVSDPLVYADFVGAGKLVVSPTGDDNRLKHAVGDTSIGTEAASGSEATYGNDREFEFPIPGSPSPFELEVQYDDADSTHRAIADAAGGTKCEIASVTMTAADEITVRVVQGALKGDNVSNSPTALQKMTVSIAVENIYTVRAA